MKPGRPSLDHTQAPASILSDTCVAYYRSVSANPYIQHILPGFQMTLQTTQDSLCRLDTDEEEEDQHRSVSLYWETVASNVPRTEMGETCTASYGLNVFAMLFAYAHTFGHGYSLDLTLDLTLGQSLALHQASGLVDALTYLRPMATLQQRVSWFGQLYPLLVALYIGTRRIGLFVPAAVVFDLFHHSVHAAASIWRFGIVEPQRPFLLAKLQYHVYHWVSLVLSLPIYLFTHDAVWNDRVCTYWRSSHRFERQSHRGSRSCTPNRVNTGTVTR